MIEVNKVMTVDPIFETICSRIRESNYMINYGDAPTAIITDNEIWLNKTFYFWNMDYLHQIMLAIAFKKYIPKMENAWKTDTEHDYSKLKAKICSLISDYAQYVKYDASTFFDGLIECEQMLYQIQEER